MEVLEPWSPAALETWGALKTCRLAALQPCACSPEDMQP